MDFKHDDDFNDSENGPLFFAAVVLCGAIGLAALVLLIYIISQGQ